MSQKGSLRAVVIGLGNIGIGYDASSWNKPHVFSHSKAYLRCPGYKLIFGVDSSLSSRTRFTVLTGKPAYSSVDEFDGEKPDIVSVCVPTRFHAAAVRSAIQLKPRYILCEKPLADNIRDGKYIVQTLKKRKIGLVVNYIRRWEWVTHKLKDFLQSGKLGRVESIRCHYSTGVLNNASHAIDILCYLFGRPQRVQSAHGKPSSIENDYDADFVLAFSQFLANFECGSEKERSRFDIEFFTSLATVHYSDKELKVCWKNKKKPQVIKSKMDRYQYHVMAGILKSIRSQKPFESNEQSAMNAMNLSLEVIRKCKR